jgi:hypothetical protein
VAVLAKRERPCPRSGARLRMQPRPLTNLEAWHLLYCQILHTAMHIPIYLASQASYSDSRTVFGLVWPDSIHSTSKTPRACQLGFFLSIHPACLVCSGSD